MSQAKDLLVREAELGREAAKMVPSQVLIQYQPAVGPVNGWYALGGRVAKQAITFRSWLLASQPTAVKVGDILEILFIEDLGHMYAGGRLKTTEPLGSFAFTPYRQRNWIGGGACRE